MLTDDAFIVPARGEGSARRRPRGPESSCSPTGRRFKTKMKGKGGRHRDRRNASIPKQRRVPTGCACDQKAKKRNTRVVGRTTTTRRVGRVVRETPETAAASRRTRAEPRDAFACRPVRFDGGDYAPRASAPPRPSDDARILDDTALAPEAATRFFAAASASRGAAGDGLSQDLRAARVEAARLDGVAPVLRVRASRFKPAGREPLGERVRGAPLSRRPAPDRLRCPADGAQQRFLWKRFAGAELAENLGETELPSEARRDVIEGDAVASVVAAARRARVTPSRRRARASGTPANSARLAPCALVEKPSVGQRRGRRRAAGNIFAARRGTRDDLGTRARACACGCGRPRWSSAPSTSRSWRACGTAADEPPARRRRKRRRTPPRSRVGAFCETRPACATRTCARRSRRGARVVAAQGAVPPRGERHHAALHGEVFDAAQIRLASCRG